MKFGKALVSFLVGIGKVEAAVTTVGLGAVDDDDEKNGDTTTTSSSVITSSEFHDIRESISNNNDAAHQYHEKKKSKINTATVKLIELKKKLNFMNNSPNNNNNNNRLMNREQPEEDERDDVPHNKNNIDFGHLRHNNNHYDYADEKINSSNNGNDPIGMNHDDSTAVDTPVSNLLDGGYYNHDSIAATTTAKTTDEKNGYDYDYDYGAASNDSSDYFDYDNNSGDHISGAIMDLFSAANNDGRQNVTTTTGRRRNLVTAAYCDSYCDNNRPVVSPREYYEFQDLVDHCISRRSNCEFGRDTKISCWDTSRITDMKMAFYYQNEFNEPLLCWDVSRVTSMDNMFYNAWEFNQPIGNWDVSNVANKKGYDLYGMFEKAYAFNQNINEWDVSNARNPYAMFYHAFEFNSPLNGWNVGRVTDMSYMFIGCTDFNQPLHDWDVSNVKKFKKTFAFASNFSQPINYWNVGRAKEMSWMFEEAYSFNQCLGSWAERTPNNVKTDEMLNVTACPLEDDITPDSSVGPWCQGPEDSCTTGIPLPVEFPTPVPETKSPIATTTAKPTALATANPTASPTTGSPSAARSNLPTGLPTITGVPSGSTEPSVFPSEKPSKAPPLAEVTNESAVPAGTNAKTDLETGMEEEINRIIDEQQRFVNERQRGATRNLQEAGGGTCRVAVTATDIECDPDRVTDADALDCFSVRTVIQEPQSAYQGDSTAGCDVNTAARDTDASLRSGNIQAAGTVIAGSVTITLATDEPSSQPSALPSISPTTFIEGYNCIDNPNFVLKLKTVGTARVRKVGCQYFEQNRSKCLRGNKSRLFMKNCPASCEIPICTCKDNQYVTFRIGRKNIRKQCQKIGRRYCEKGDNHKVKIFCPKRCKVDRCLDS